MDIFTLTALEVGQKIRAGEITVMQAVESVFQRIEATEDKLNCYIITDKEKALARAKEVQAKIEDGTLTSPLAGVPISLKDNICTTDMQTTAGSKTLANFVPTYSATVAERLEEAGMIIIGKLNMDEFAMGSTTETSYFGETKNPWNTERVPGGSSGGCAAAVAADSAMITLGSDTGGSIRQPSSFCGVTGLKPTYGSVSRSGVVPLASSFDQVGPIGKAAADCAALFEIIRGKDEKDGTSMPLEDFSLDKVQNENIAGMKFALPKEFLGEGLDEDVKAAILNAKKQLESLGATVEEVEFDMLQYIVPTYYIISCAEASSNMARYDGVRYGYRSEKAQTLDELYTMSRSEGFGLEVKRRILLGNFVLSSGYYDAYYNKALQARRLIQEALFNLFKSYDAVIGPVAPSTAFAFGKATHDPIQTYLADIYTAIANIAGVPSLSTPCGFDSEGMPIGLQIIGKPFEEETILHVAHAFESVNDAHKQKPNLQ